jgi:hypothetical protein
LRCKGAFIGSCAQADKPTHLGFLGRSGLFNHWFFRSHYFGGWFFDHWLFYYRCLGGGCLSFLPTGSQEHRCDDQHTKDQIEFL